MNRYVLTRRAEQDLEEILEYVANESADSAQIVLRDIREALERLADMPGIGHQRKDVPDDRYRFWLANRFIIAYFPKTKPLQIVRIVGAKRDFRALFRSR
jgi:antitoxin ParD1/3/4/toxin ParE1/3/4